MCWPFSKKIKSLLVKLPRPISETPIQSWSWIQKILRFTFHPPKRDRDRNCNKANTDLDSTRQGLSTDILIIYFTCGVLEIQFGGRLTIRVADGDGKRCADLCPFCREPRPSHEEGVKLTKKLMGKGNAYAFYMHALSHEFGNHGIPIDMEKLMSYISRGRRPWMW